MIGHKLIIEDDKMKYLFIGTIFNILVGSVAFAQQADQQSSSPPVEYTLKITPQELDLLGKALGNQPYNDVAPLLQKLRSQFVEQNKLKKVEPVKK